MKFQIIMWLCIGWLPILMYFMLQNETKFKKNIALGVTLPYDARKDEEVVSVLRKFKCALALVCALLVLLAVGGAFLQNMSLSMTLWGIWVLLAVVAPYVPYVLSHQALRRIKAARGWTYAEKQVVTVDTSLMQPMKRRAVWLYVPPFVVSLLPLAWERSFLILYIVDAVFVVFCWLAERYLLRSRAERVDDNASLTAVLTQIRRHNWGKMWLLVAWCLALMSPISALSMTNPALMSVLFVALLLVMLACALGIEFRLRRVQEKLTAESGRGSYVDEDDKWIWGLFYYDKNDKKLIVNNRVGSNTTVNIAHTAGKVLMVAVALILLMIPLMFPLMESVGGAVTLELREEVLDGGSKKYELPIAEIAEVELLEELPQGLVRVVGSAMPNLLRGRFTSPETGKLMLSLDPTDGPYLLVTMTSGEKYLLGGRDGVIARIGFALLGKLADSRCRSGQHDRADGGAHDEDQQRDCE